MSTTDEGSKCVEPRSRRDYVTSLTLPWPAVLLQRWNLMVAASCGVTSQLEVIADRPFRSRIMLECWMEVFLPKKSCVRRCSSSITLSVNLLLASGAEFCCQLHVTRLSSDSETFGFLESVVWFWMIRDQHGLVLQDCLPRRGGSPPFH